MSPRERLKCRPQLIMLRSSQIFFIKLLSFIFLLIILIIAFTFN